MTARGTLRGWRVRHGGAGAPMCRPRAVPAAKVPGMGRDDGARFGALVNIAAAHAQAERAELALRESVRAAREAGATWQSIGDALGVTKQTAWERFWRACGPSYHTA